jgi:hypothetical protein
MQTVAAAHQSCVPATSATNQRRKQEAQQRVVLVQDPQAGWTSLEGGLWWHAQLAHTSLASTSRLEVLPTVYGRYVLAVTPHDDEATAWFWSSGRQVRHYLEQLRAPH